MTRRKYASPKTKWAPRRGSKGPNANEIPTNGQVERNLTVPQHKHIDRILQAVFGPDYSSHAAFATNDGSHYWPVYRKLSDLDDQLGCYWSIAAYPDDGIEKRTAARAIEVRALFLDDIKPQDEARVRAVLGPPTLATRTSPGNCHWIYRLATPVAEKDWNGFFRAVIAHVGAGDPSSCTSIHWTRLPMGLNLKAGTSYHGFKVEVAEFNDGITLEPTTIPGWAPGMGRSRAKSGSGNPWQQKIFDIKELVAMTPNTGGWKEWIASGYAIVVLMAEEGPGREAFFEFSARSLDKKPFSEDLTEGRWASFYPDRADTDGGWMIEAAWEAMVAAGTEERFDAFWQREASLGPVFDDGLVRPDPFAEPPKAPPDPAAGLGDGAFQFGDPKKIPIRDWLYGRVLIRKFMSMTVAPGGSGKSSLVLAECVAMASGRNLLGVRPRDTLGVWYWNLEDPLEEVSRRLHAVSLRYGVTNGEIGGRLFVTSGRDTALVLVKMEGGRPVVQEKRVEALIASIRARGVDVLVIDPYVSCHEVGENDNVAQDMVVKTFGRIAEAGGCAVHLVDHTRKVRQGEGAEVGTESARGAKAKTDAARMVRVINRMTQREADALGGVPDAWRHFHAYADKANMAPPVDDRDWFRLATVNLGNGGGAAGAFGALSAGVVHGDDVGVVEEWTPPTPAVIAASTDFQKIEAAMAGKRWRADSQAKAEPWIGEAIGTGLGFDPKGVAGKARVATLVKAWLKAGIFISVTASDANRKEREYIELAP